MKPGVFTQMYIQLVFAVRNRDAALHPATRNQVFKYISGIVTNLNHKSIIVNGVSDHVHIFLGLHPNITISDTVKEIKQNSSLFINKEKLCLGKFSWQEGYGAFSYSRSQIENVYNYILKQEQHHKKQTFKEEYLDFLKKFEVEYNPEFLFHFWDE
jgi:putative transposase